MCLTSNQIVKYLTSTTDYLAKAYDEATSKLVLSPFDSHTRLFYITASLWKHNRGGQKGSRKNLLSKELLEVAGNQLAVTGLLAGSLPQTAGSQLLLSRAVLLQPFASLSKFARFGKCLAQLFSILISFRLLLLRAFDFRTLWRFRFGLRRSCGARFASAGLPSLSTGSCCGLRSTSASLKSV